METVKEWARSLFLISIFSSTALLLVPKSMQRQARFVAEMLILLCVVAPLARMLTTPAASTIWSSMGSNQADQGSLGEFYAWETARMVAEIGRRAGIPVKTVEVGVGETGLSLSAVTVYLSGPVDPEAAQAFRDSVAAYLGVPKDKLQVCAIQTGQGSGGSGP